MPRLIPYVVEGDTYESATKSINSSFDAIEAHEQELEGLKALVEGLQEQVGLLMEVSERKDAEVDRLREQLSQQEDHLTDVMKWAFTKIQGGVGADPHEYLVNKPEFDEWLTDHDYQRGKGLTAQKPTVYDEEIKEMQRKARAVLGELCRENDYYTDFEDIVEQVDKDLEEQAIGYDFNPDGTPRLRMG